MKSRSAYWFLIPAFMLLAVFAFFPALQVFYYSMLDYNVFTGNTFIGFDNYMHLFSDSSFWYALQNSVLFIIVTPVLMVLSLMLALAVRQQSGSGGFFRFLFFLPVITPVVIAGIIWRWIFAEDTGMMNYLLSLISIPQIPWLTEYPVNLASVMILTIWRGFGYYMMLFLAGLAIIPKELEEASRLDGANKFQQVWHIILPVLKPTLLLVFVISSTNAVKIFTELYIMIPGTPDYNKTLVYYLYKQAFENFSFGTGSAAGVVIFLLTMGFSVINIKLLEREQI